MQISSEFAPKRCSQLAKYSLRGGPRKKNLHTASLRSHLIYDSNLKENKENTDKYIAASDAGDGMRCFFVFDSLPPSGFPPLSLSLYRMPLMI